MGGYPRRNIWSNSTVTVLLGIESSAVLLWRQACPSRSGLYLCVNLFIP